MKCYSVLIVCVFFFLCEKNKKFAKFVHSIDFYLTNIFNPIFCHKLIVINQTVLLIRVFLESQLNHLKLYRPYFVHIIISLH